ncbi:cytochrome C oxidase subunit IV family protein [Staphylospora marina]|uniref:cytochrome C oxidase subunit IV family protein n=1 Tax=Staphylospora marina TaxID=2490858 RepID=UPI000F5B9560|nr:cytochrome C oxidase subunit IV family protein [Staphylospora marina]
MEPKPEPRMTPKVRTQTESAWKYVFSFFWMILFTAISFWIVLEGTLGTEATFWSITALAAVQVVLQLITFMHLDFGKYRFVAIFMALGIFIAVVSAIGIVLMP